MSKGFNLGEYLKGSGPMRASAPTEDGGVSELNTGREELRYLPLDQIDPDPANFYSLEGLDELAGSIELIGLQQPLRVRPASTSSGAGAPPSPQGEGRTAMRYIVVSGHRRRAACMMIRDGGNSMFDGGVPCLVDYGEASDAMRELRLIFANSATRVMSSAEQSKQAERVTELLYQLKEQGVEFPGRMRDHVAEACNLSRSKIGRLQAIRGNLIPDFLTEYDAGRINESVAYRISQEEAGIQAALAKAPAIVRGETAEKIGQIIDKLKASSTPVGADPQISPPTLHKTYVDSDSLKNYLEKRAEEDEKYFEMLSDVANVFFPCIGGVPSRQEGIAALKQKHGSRYHGGSVNGKSCWYFNAEPKGLNLEPKRGPVILRTWTEVYDLLCTIAVARLLAKNYKAPAYRTGDPPQAELCNAGPHWGVGDPPQDGRYLCTIAYSNSGSIQEVTMDYKKRPEGAGGSAWLFFGAPLSYAQVTGWWPLPERMEEK